MLRVEGLSLHLADFAIKDVSFTLNAGEILALLGPNGSGKTTILRSIYGLLRPQRGKVWIKEKNFHRLSLKERARLIGYVPQMHRPVFAYTVLEFVTTGLAAQIGLFGSPKKEHYQRALSVLKILDLEGYKDRPYSALSGGEIQLVRLAQVLVRAPKVLLLDEPTAHLDLKNQIKIMDIIKKLAQEGLATLMTLHDPNLASFYADKVALIKEGKIIGTGSPSSLFQPELLQRLYDIPLRVLDQDGLKIVVSERSPL